MRTYSLVTFPTLQLLSLLSSNVEAHRSGVHVHQPMISRSLLHPNGSASTNSTSSATSNVPYWLENIEHQGVAPFHGNSKYEVFRNVKDYGAKGDGTSDDTEAINLAISSGGRCAPGKCESSTKTPAIVYFPAGTYKISSSIIDYYFTQIIGNPNDVPIIKASASFTNFSLVDGNQYQPGNAANPAGTLGFKPTNVFYRQVKNLVLDSTAVPANQSLNCLHWPTGQATSVENVVFRMNTQQGTQHQGLFIEEGSGGFIGDLAFFGGLTGATLGSQQFTSRNLTFHNCVEAINQIFDWSWTYKSISINDCGLGFNFSSGGPSAQNVGSVTLIDSIISNTPIGILTAHNTNGSTFSNGSLVLENVQLQNVSIAIQGPRKATLLKGSSGSQTIAGWGQGHQYAPSRPVNFQGPTSPLPRPASLLDDDKFHEQSKPSYADRDVSSLLSARSTGARGNGVVDDTAALQKLIDQAASSDKIVFFDAGIYRITKTLNIPPGSKLVGESYPVIMSSGSYFANMHSPKPVIQVGKPGQEGSVEWSDMIVSTQGAQAGAILIEWNLATTSKKPSGMWDVHTRIGGFAGSKLGIAECPISLSNSNSTTSTSRPSGALPSGYYPTAPSASSSSTYAASPYANSTLATTSSSTSFPANINTHCIAAHTSLHLTPSSSGLYLENVWLWTADHDIDAPKLPNITIYTGRGLLDQSRNGRIWMYGTSVEHHALYQYQFENTKDVVAGMIQTETAYWQPAAHPFVGKKNNKSNGSFASDPNLQENGGSGWGLRIVGSRDVAVYGAGLYSFFDGYNNSCSFQAHSNCQAGIFSVEGTQVNVYNLNTVGAIDMIDRDGQVVAKARDNVGVFANGIALFETE